MIFLIWCKVSNYIYIWLWKFNIIQHSFNRMITVQSQSHQFDNYKLIEGSLVISRCELPHFEMKWFKTVLLMASNRAIKIIHFKIFTINFNRSRGVWRHQKAENWNSRKITISRIQASLNAKRLKSKRSWERSTNGRLPIQASTWRNSSNHIHSCTRNVHFYWYIYMKSQCKEGASDVNFHWRTLTTCKLRTPFKHDSRCALFSILSFATTNSTLQREAQRMSCLKGVQRLYAKCRKIFKTRLWLKIFKIYLT